MATPAASTDAHNKYYNPVVMSFIRDDWIQQQLRRRQAEYTASEAAKVVVGTWNVNGKKPQSSATAVPQLQQWLHLQSGRTAPDLVAVGFQEMVDLNAVNVVVNNNVSSTRSSLWVDALLSALSETYRDLKYRIVMYQYLVGLLVVVVVRSDHVDAKGVRDIAGDTAGVGIMGVMGNKGGVAVRLSFYDTTFCFVCGHLAAHRHNIEGRNSDYANILSKLDLGVNQTGHFSSSIPILQHDVVFFFGDLNYRIEDDISDDAIFELAIKGDLTHLLKRDQLRIEKQNNRVLQGFQEGDITFPPTYKYQAGTNVYDRRPDKKVRTPAWCDRVLWKCKNSQHVSLLQYESVQALTMSDHKPVVAVLETQVQRQIEDKKVEVIRDILTQLDKWENEHMPRIRLLKANGEDLDEDVLVFKNVRFATEQTKVLTICNSGQVVAHFRFVPKLEDKVIAKRWLQVSPTFGMIPPGERQQVLLTIQVDQRTAQALTAGEESLDDTLILRVENGRDYFLVLSGQYENSCFGNSLEQLVISSRPARDTPLPVALAHQEQLPNQSHLPSSPVASPLNVMTTTTSPGSPPLSPEARHSLSSSREASWQHQAQKPENAGRVPKELWRLIDDLYRHSLDDKHLFVETGSKHEITGLREALDSGRPFPEHSGYAAAECLLRWLRSLRNSVVPETALEFVHTPSQHEASMEEAATQLMDALSPIRYNVLLYLVSFLKEVLEHREENRLTPEKLAFIFSRCLVSHPFIGTELESGGRSSIVADSSMSFVSSGATANSSSSDEGLPVEARIRQTAREEEREQVVSNRRAEKMERILLHLLTHSIRR